MSADKDFAALIDRILRCREAEDAAKDDTKEVYAELAAKGHDKTAAGALVAELRKKDKNQDKFTERNAMLELYRDAYDRAKGSHAHTHTREATSYAEAKGVDPKLIETVVKGVQTDIGRKALVTALDIMIEREEAETNSPETAHGTNPSDGSVNPHGEPVAVAANMENDHVDSSAERASSAVQFGATNSPETATISGGVEVAGHGHSPFCHGNRTDDAVIRAPSESASDEISATNSHSLPTSSPVADTADSVTPPALSAPHSDDVPAFLKSKEGCLRPGDCKTHFTSVLCSGCANERAKRLVNA